MPQEIWHNKIRLPGYEEFNSQEYYKLAKEKAAEVIVLRDRYGFRAECNFNKMLIKY